MKKFGVLIVFIFLISPWLVFAGIGVGIGTGEINISAPLKAGGIYELPPLVIFNTGSDAGEYSIGVQYHKEQKQIRPEREWFHFNPPNFYLEPGQAQKVEVQLILPLKTEPGDYFAYLEGQASPKENIGGGVSVGVAAASKLYFTVTPANIWQAIYYRLSSLWKKYSTWSLVISILVAGAVIIVLFRTFFRRFFKLNIKISKK